MVPVPIASPDQITGGLPKTSRAPTCPLLRISASTTTESGAWISSIPFLPARVTTFVAPAATDSLAVDPLAPVPSEASARKRVSTTAVCRPTLVSQILVVYEVPAGVSSCRTGT